MHRAIFADEFRGAVAVAIADATIRLSQHESEWNARTHTQFTNGFHALTSREPKITVAAAAAFSRPEMKNAVGFGRRKIIIGESVIPSVIW
jgi:hypothetical protein